MMRSTTQTAGRAAGEVKYLHFISSALGKTEQEAVPRRMVLEAAAGIDKRLAQLSALLGVRLDPSDRDK